MDASHADLETAPSLNLDYNAVMSSWEKMGRNASGGSAAAMGDSGELPLDLSFLEGKGFGEDSNERDPLDIFTFCDLFDADDLTFSSAPPQQQRRSPNGARAAAAAAAAAAAGVVPGSAQAFMLPRANSDMMVPCCERAGSGSLMPTFEQSAAVAPDQYPTYEQYLHAPFPQAAEHHQQQQHQQQQQQQQPTYMTIYTPVMVQMTGPSPFASYAASPFAPYANAAPFTNTGMVGSDDGSGGGGAFYHHAPLMASMHGCMPVPMSLIRAATGPLPPSPMLRQTSAPCSGNVLGRTCSAAYSERRSNGGMSNLSRAASGCNNCNGADQQAAYVSMAGGNSGYEVQQRPTCRAGNVGCGARYGGRLDGTAESCHHTLNTCEPRSRAECLARYRSKKARRLHTKMIRYHLRKINADNRPRYKGRFVKKGEMLPPTIGEAMPPIVVDE